jgi:hypothetical protein
MECLNCVDSCVATGIVSATIRRVMVVLVVYCWLAAQSVTQQLTVMCIDDRCAPLLIMLKDWSLKIQKCVGINFRVVRWDLKLFQMFPNNTLAFTIRLMVDLRLVTSDHTKQKALLSSWHRLKSRLQMSKQFFLCCSWVRESILHKLFFISDSRSSTFWASHSSLTRFASSKQSSYCADSLDDFPCLFWHRQPTEP